jgi:hypothetical protein
MVLLPKGQMVLPRLITCATYNYQSTFIYDYKWRRQAGKNG